MARTKRRTPRRSRARRRQLPAPAARGVAPPPGVAGATDSASAGDNRESLHNQAKAARFAAKLSDAGLKTTRTNLGIQVSSEIGINAPRPRGVVKRDDPPAVWPDGRRRVVIDEIRPHV